MNEGGLEWLARLGLQTNRSLSKSEIKNAAPSGARKVYEQVKRKRISGVRNSDLF